MKKEILSCFDRAFKQWLLLFLSGRTEQRVTQDFSKVRVAMLLAFLGLAFQVDAQHILKGTVVDQNDKPLYGTSIQVKGATLGTTTDISGRFILEIANPKDTLVISYVGYFSLEVQAGTERERVFKLTQDVEASKLNEVVVVGFGTQKKITVTGSIATISTQEIQRASTPSLSNAIAGKIPGIISRQSSGNPGGDAAQVYIRGLGTLSPGIARAPLVLVDGIERDLNNINAQEVESFSILKDASATAVFGVRGANGVIMITSKRGKVGKPQVTLRSETAMLTSVRMPEYINGYEYAGLINEGAARDGNALRYSDEELQKFADGSDPYLYPSVNWSDVVFKKNTYQNITNLSIAGGSDVFRYYTNVGVTNQNGIYKEDKLNEFNTNANMKRYNFRSNVDINLSKNLTMDLSLAGIIHKQNYPGNFTVDLFKAVRQTTPIDFPVLNPDGSLGGVPDFVGFHPYGIATQSGYQTYFKNTLQGTFGTKWDLSDLVTPGLSLSGRFAFDYFSFNQGTRQKVFEVKRYLGIDDVTGEEKYTLLRPESPLGYIASNVANRAIYSEASINYNRSFNDHSLSGLLLYNQRDFVDLMAASSINNLPARRLGFAGRVSYSYKNKYLFETNLGYNGSENFPKGKRFGFFPSVSAGWIISNENFWGDWLVNSLKIRGSYGQVGNDQLVDNNNNPIRFLFLDKITTAGGSYFFGQDQVPYTGYDESKIGNPDVTWEVSTKANLGLDVNLLAGKLNLQVDGFTERREGILMQRQTVPDFAGFFGNVIPFANLGIVKNKGFDALAEFNNKTSSGWFYSFRSNFTFVRNKIIENDQPQPMYSYQDIHGQSIRVDQPLHLMAIGFFKDQEDIDNSPEQTFDETERPGDIKYRDVNGDGRIDDNDRVYIGYPRIPEIMFGFGGTVGYKGLDVSLYFTGATNTSIFLQGPSMYPFANGLGTNNIVREYYDNRWTPERPNAEYPAAGSGNSANNFRPSTVWMKDASYLRLRNAEIGYSFQPAVLKRLRLKGIRAFVNGMNLYTWDKVKMIDPEADNGTGNYPIQRSVNLGAQITF